jgi:hypothetical protein
VAGDPDDLLTITEADQAAATTGPPGLHQTARAPVGQAEEAARPATWTRDLAPLPDAAPEPVSPADAAAVAAIAAKVESGVPKTRHDKAVAGMLSGLGQTAPGLYEPELTTLGRPLGASAAKPAGRAAGATRPGAGRTPSGSRSRPRATRSPRA